MTRAKDELHLLLPQRFDTRQQPRRGDRHLYAARTRFIPDALLPLFALRTWPTAGAVHARRIDDQPRIDIGARMRGMWR